MGRVTDSIRGGHNPLDDGGLAALFASPEQKAVLDQVGGLMSLLEGHGDVTMDRAGQGPRAVRRPVRRRAAQPPGRRPAACRGCSSGSSASKPSCSSTRRARSSSRSSRITADRADRSGLGRAREPAVDGRDPRPAGLDRPGGTAARGVSLVDELAARCRFPDRPDRWTCAVSGGADSLALLVLACRPAARSPRSTSITDCGTDSAADAGSSPTRPAVRRRVLRPSGRVEPGSNLEARARAARYSVLPDGV